jgi:hypothetical protein
MDQRELVGDQRSLYMGRGALTLKNGKNIQGKIHVFDFQMMGFFLQNDKYFSMVSMVVTPSKVHVTLSKVHATLDKVH